MAILIYAGVIALHAGLLPGAEWQGDEYATLFWLHAGPVVWVRHILSWSPRPIALGLLFAYGWLVEATGRQMPWLLLCGAWGLLVAGGVLGTRRLVRAMVPGTPAMVAWSIGGAILTLFLLGHPVAEAFYWPVSAIAYLPAMGAITFTTLLLLSGEPLPRLWLASALCLAAGSAEVGAMFVCCLAGPAVVRSVIAGQRRAAWFWGPILLVGLAVLLTVALVRVRSGSELYTADPTYFGHPLASLQGGAVRLAREFAGEGRYVVALAHVALIVGCAAGLRTLRRRPSGPRLVWIAAALAGTAYLSIAPALFTFGFACCERQSTFRQCVYVLLCVVAGAALAGTAPARRLGFWTAAIAGVALPMLAVVLLLTPAAGDRVAGLIADYSALPGLVRERRENWAAGEVRGRPSMVFRFRAKPAVLNAFWATPGRYTGPDFPQWQFKFVADYFGKSTIDIEPAPLNP